MLPMILSFNVTPRAAPVKTRTIATQTEDHYETAASATTALSALLSEPDTTLWDTYDLLLTFSPLNKLPPLLQKQLAMLKRTAQKKDQAGVLPASVPVARREVASKKLVDVLRRCISIGDRDQALQMQ